MQETQKMWVRSLGQEYPLEEEKVTHSSILTWKIPWTEKPDRLQSTDHKESDTTELLSEYVHMVHIDNGILLNHKRNKTGSFVELWMDPESVIQSEKRNSKINMSTYICGIWKNGTDEPICRAGIETRTSRIDVWTHRGRSGMN